MQTLKHENLKIVRGIESWTQYKIKSVIYDCRCGGKYIVTFKNQTVCPRCSEYIVQKRLANLNKHAIGVIN